MKIFFVEHIGLDESCFKNNLYKYMTEHQWNCILKAVCAVLWMFRALVFQFNM